MYIVGTPKKRVAFQRSIARATTTGLKRSMSSRVDPAYRGTFMTPASPPAWNSGRADTTVSSPSAIWNHVANWMVLATRLACVSMAPFGVPVVPPVYMSNARSACGSTGRLAEELVIGLEVRQHRDAQARCHCAGGGQVATRRQEDAGLRVGYLAGKLGIGRHGVARDSCRAEQPGGVVARNQGWRVGQIERDTIAALHAHPLEPAGQPPSPGHQLAVGPCGARLAGRVVDHLDSHPIGMPFQVLLQDPPRRLERIGQMSRHFGGPGGVPRPGCHGCHYFDVTDRV